MKYDYQALYNKNAAFYHARPMAKLALKLANITFSWLFVAAYAVLWTYALWLQPLGPKEIVGISLPPCLAFLCSTALRLFFKRPRPYTENGANITPLTQKKHADNASFPSRHLACAASIAMVFLPHYLFAGVALLAISLLLGYARFALGLHYPSDLLAGESIGIALGYLVFIV